MDLSPLVLIASASEGGAHSNPLLPEANEAIWGALAFLVLFLALSKFAFPKMNAMMKERAENIEGKLEQAERERRDAHSLKTQYQNMMNEVDVETQRRMEKAKANADRLESELRAEAEEKARRIVARAEENIASERDRAERELSSEVGNLAIDLSQRIIGEELDRNRHMRLVDQYIAELKSPTSTSINKSSSSTDASRN